MTEPESESTPRAILAYLRERGIDAALTEPGVPMPTVPLAAAAIGVPETQIIKSLLFIDKTGMVVLAIAAGTDRIDRAKLAAVSGLVNPKLAPPGIVLARTGYPAGGVAPVAHSTPIPVVIDTRAAAQPFVHGGAGVEEALLRIRPADIMRLTGATVADITLRSITF